MFHVERFGSPLGTRAPSSRAEFPSPEFPSPEFPSPRFETEHLNAWQFGSIL